MASLQFNVAKGLAVDGNDLVEVVVDFPDTEDAQQRRPADIVAVVDVSGSMQLPATMKIEEGEFRFCGKGVKQEPIPRHDIYVSCRDTTEKMETIIFTKGSRTMNEKGSDAEISQMRSAIGSMGWVARQCRPDICYEF